MEQLKNVFHNFDDSVDLVSYQELASGHINDTYLIETSNQKCFVLQRINQGVFKDVPGLINNKVNISNQMINEINSLGFVEYALIS